VRPDAHVAWRANEVADDATAELGRVMESLLGVLETVGGER
jgi:2,4-dichlorophenol 6-monooxygenase